MKEAAKKLFTRMHNLQKDKTFKWIPPTIAFYFFISFIPFLFSILFLSIRFINVDVDWITEIIDIEGIKPILEQFVVYVKDISETSIILIAVLLVYSIYVSSKGITAVVLAINSYFGFKIPNIIKTHIIAIITIIIILVAIFALTIFASILPTITRLFPFDFNFTFIYILSIPFLYVVIHGIYIIVTDFRLNSKQIYKGALLTTFLIIIMVAFSNIIFRIGTNASVVYGSLTIIVLIGHFFLYIGFSIYFGIALNVASYQLELEAREEARYQDFKDRFKDMNGKID